ncbi:MAG: dihydroorotate dehydrogenase electron transfer subunit [Schwartzia sp.]|nr:dihydroorotate dehydrogenase electron transfer subunit [Schwartzia sp. (in: firmicutes)]
MWEAVTSLPKLALDTEILWNRQVGTDVYELTVQGRAWVSQAKPGQFLHIRIYSGDVFLRRPFGIADSDEREGHLTMYYRVAGKGTRTMTTLKRGDVVNCLGPLGHGFSLNAKRPLLVGGGMGLAPLLLLTKHFQGEADVLMGGRNREELFWEKLFKPYAHNIFIATDDGSLGTKGFTTELLPNILQNEEYDCIYTCGPEIMMRGIAKIATHHEISCQVSMEKRMACGLGACLSCVCDTANEERKKICKDGPVFWAQDVFFAQ